MGMLSEYRKKNLLRKSKKLQAKLKGAREEADIAEKVAQQQKELDKLKVKTRSASKVHQYLGGAGRTIGAAAKGFYKNREVIGQRASVMGGNLLGVTPQKPAKSGVPYYAKNRKKRS